MAAIILRELTKRYKEQTALRAVNLEVAEGEIFGLLGPNGAGKTTLVSILSTIRPFEGGQVTVCGHALPADAQSVREILGIVPQDLAVYEEMSAWDNLRYFGGLYSLPRRLLEERAKEALDIVGLSDRAKQPVRTFSGGMKRRLNLAAGLLHRPRVLLLDEPTVGVDPQSRNRIFEAIRALNREHGMTMLYTTHYMEEAEGLCDRVAIIDEGRVVACDEVSALLRQLGSATLRIDLEQDPQSIETLVASHPMLSSATFTNGTIELTTDDPEQALSEVLDLLRGQGIHLRDIQVRRPGLQEVFLQLTGKDLRD